ncbi:MAG: hypothetical protein AAF990_11440 [Bacteroidota bacterium]
MWKKAAYRLKSRQNVKEFIPRIHSFPIPKNSPTFEKSYRQMMMRKVAFMIALVGLSQLLLAQDTSQMSTTLPYHQIPDYPADYSNVNVAARLIDGLGYRYYWATEGLRSEDLDYRPSEDSRSSGQTIAHVHGLSETILNTLLQKPNIRPVEPIDRTFEQQRQLTLENLKKASDLLRATAPEDLSNFNLIFQRGERKAEFPFWHLINGPIADAIYHAGQIVAYRRASGNPMNPMVNVFMGKTKE